MFGAYHLASWGSRVGAALLDAVIAGVSVGILVGIASAAKVGGVGLLLGYAAIWFGYFPVTMMRQGEHNGQTIGKQAVGIRVLRESGQPMTYGTSLLREFVVRFLLFGVVGSVTFGIAALLDVLWPLWDDGNQALHDKIVSTRVVKVQGTPAGL